MSSPREIEVLTELIELYRNSPCLWDTNTDEYKNTILRNVSWDILTKKIKEIEPDANAATAKKKISNLRTSYKRELKKVRNAKTLGKEYRPNLWYFNRLRFLDSNEEEQNGSDPNMIEDDLEQNECSTPIKRPIAKEKQKVECSSRKRNKNIVVERKRTNQVVERRPQKTETELKEHNTKAINSFTVYIADQLQQLSTYQRQVAEKVISEVIFLAKTESLNYDSRIETPSRYRTFDSPGNSYSQVKSRSPSPQYIDVPTSPYPDSNASDQESTQDTKQGSPQYDSHSPQSIDTEPPASPSNAMLKELLISRNAE